MEQKEQSSECLLAAISRVQSYCIDDAEPEAVFGMTLQELLTLSGSTYGCISEVVRKAEQKPYVRIQAIRAFSLNGEMKVLPPNAALNPEPRQFRMLCEQVMRTGEPVVVNDPRTQGFLPSHSFVNAFAALPICWGKQLVGVVGLANRPKQYDESGLAYLEPFLSTCAQLLEGFRNRRLRTEAEEALRQSEDRFRAAIQGANEGLWDWNLKTGHVYFSPRWKAMLGYEDHEISSAYREWESRLHPDDRDGTLAQLNRYLEGKAERYDVEFRLFKKNGDYCWIHARGTVIRDAAGRPIRMAGSHTDISERKREEALQVAENQTLELVAKGKSLHEVLPFMCRAIEAVTAPMICSIMLVSKDVTSLLFGAGPSLPDDYIHQLNGIRIGLAVGSCGSVAYYSTPMFAEDVTVHPFWKDYAHIARRHNLRACWSQPVKGMSGKVLGTFAAYYREPRLPEPSDGRVLERVSSIAALAIEHARMTEALQESEARFQAFMRHSPAVSFIKDSDGHYLYGNPRFEMLSGLSKDDLRTKTVLDFLPREIANRISQQDKLVLTSGQPLEMEETLEGPDGTLQDLLVNKFPLRMGQYGLLGGVAINITERRSLERASQDQADRLRLAMDIAKLATWDWNILTNQVIWSENREEVNGLPLGSFDGTFEAYQRLVHPEDLPKLLADIESALSGQHPYRTEHRIVPPSGEVQWVEGNGVVY